jgi:hypothetical protein
MNPASEDVKDMLVAESLSLVFATNLFIAREPETPSIVTTIFDVPGSSPQLTLKKGEDYFYDSIQIRVRHTSYLTGYTLAKNIRAALHGRAGETWSSTYYSVIICLNGPFLLEWDDNNRCIFIVNFNIQRR